MRVGVTRQQAQTSLDADFFSYVVHDLGNYIFVALKIGNACQTTFELFCAGKFQFKRIFESLHCQSINSVDSEGFVHALRSANWTFHPLPSGFFKAKSKKAFWPFSFKLCIIYKRTRGDFSLCKTIFTRISLQNLSHPPLPTQTNALLINST